MSDPAIFESEARFQSYVEGLSSVIGHADRASPFRDYCLGLLMPGERKSVEPMAAITSPARVAAQHQSLLHFVGQAPWSDERVLAKVRDLVVPAMERSGQWDYPGFVDGQRTWAGCGIRAAAWSSL